jgi:hypothetical protein
MAAIAINTHYLQVKTAFRLLQDLKFRFEDPTLLPKSVQNSLLSFHVLVVCVFTGVWSTGILYSVPCYRAVQQHSVQCSHLDSRLSDRPD